MMSYSTWLKLRREESGLSQVKLAELSGISRTHINKIENGHVQTPGREMREAINDALNIPNDDPGYLRTLPPHERAVAALARKEAEMSAGELLDRALLFATGRERAVIEELVLALDRLFPTEGTDR